MPLNSSVGVELKTVKRRSGPKTAGGRSSSALQTLKPAVPAAIAIASEATAMDVSFACFLRMRRENRILDQSAMFAPISEAHQHRYPKIYHDLVPVPDKSRNCSSTNTVIHTCNETLIRIHRRSNAEDATFCSTGESLGE